MTQGVNKRFPIALLLILLPLPPILASGSIAQAQLASSPWPMFQHDARHTGQSQFDTSSNQGGLKWILAAAQAQDGQEFVTPPVIGADGTIYIVQAAGYVGQTLAYLDAVKPDGTIKWVKTAATSDIPGRFSTPAVAAEGTIYAALNSDLCAFNPDGSKKWEWTPPQAFYGVASYVASAPAIGPDGTIYTVGDFLYAVNPDGTMKWKYPINASTYGAPALGPDKAIYVQGGYDLYEIDTDGGFNIDFEHPCSVVPQPSVSSPSLAADGTTLYFGSACYTFDAADLDRRQTLLWSVPLPLNTLVATTPAIDSSGNVYVGMQANLVSFDSSGSQRWSAMINSDGEGLDNSPAIGAEGTIYMGGENNSLYAVNPDGSFKWQVHGTENSYGASSAAIGADGTVYIVMSDRHLHAIGPGGALPTATATATSTPTATPTAKTSPTRTPKPTRTRTPTPTKTPKPTRTRTPTPTRTPRPTRTRKPTPTKTPRPKKTPDATD